MKKIIIALTFCLIAGIGTSYAQHVVAVTGGAGMSTARLYPTQEMRPLWGTGTAGVSWRYYSLPRFVGCVGVDLEWVQRGFSYAPYASIYEDKSQYKYYTRRLNTMFLPIVWQPHFYLFKNHLRVYLEAAATFMYNFAATFENREPYTFNGTVAPDNVISGKYDLRLERDNRFGFGLAGGGGIDLIFGQLEVGARVRYDFGYSDIMRNRNKYYNNDLDQQNKPGENPFWYTPLRSPMDNLNICLRIGWRFNKEGFAEWNFKPKKRNKNDIVKFAL